ncbi:MAG: hypothetical protein U0521_25205 [Anaerolineae bacterium]
MSSAEGIVSPSPLIITLVTGARAAQANRAEFSRRRRLQRHHSAGGLSE